MNQKQLKDTAIRHAVLLEQLKTGEIKDLQGYYRQLDKLIRELLTRHELTQLTPKRYQLFLKTSQAEIEAVLKEMAEGIHNKVTDIALYEAEFEHKNLTYNLGRNFKPLTNALLISALSTIPLQISGANAGQTITQAIQLIPNEANRLVSGIKVGVAQGKTNNEIITAVRGTKAYQYTDGLLNVTRNSLDSTTRTLISHSATVAKEELYRANDDIIEGVQWVSTLDRRTTAGCRMLDGRLFRQGEGPRPPIHYNCRSVVIPVTRLSKLFSQGSTRASETGQVSGDLTYYTWLQEQSSAFQDQALGTTRGQLFRDGGLSAERFAQLQIDRNFRPITLARMRELEPLAFERAGL